MLTRLSRLADLFLDGVDVLFTAARVAAVVDRGDRPDARDLSRLGIAPRAFASVQLG